VSATAILLVLFRKKLIFKHAGIAPRPNISEDRPHVDSFAG
jgi:hypothetical protein